MFFFVASKVVGEDSENGSSGELSVQVTGSEMRRTVSAIFSAGVLQNSTVDGVFFWPLVPTFPRRRECTAFASLWFVTASSAVL